jgi:hypothetical protein
MIVSCCSMQEEDAIEHTNAKFHVFTPTVNWLIYIIQPRDKPYICLSILIP